MYVVYKLCIHIYTHNYILGVTLSSPPLPTPSFVAWTTEPFLMCLTA